jgi:hypothetical protein
MKRLDELVRRHACLLEQTYQRADFDFLVIGNDTACRSATHDDVTAALTGNHKTQAHQCPNEFRA